MEKLKLPKHKRLPGLYLYCNKHKRHYSDDTKVKCKCQLVYKAKIHIPNTRNECKTKIFYETDFDKVLLSFLGFKETLEATSFQNFSTKKDVVPIYLTDCIQAFEDYLKNRDVPIHKAINRLKKTGDDYLRQVNALGFALVNNGINPSKLRFTDINDDMVGMFCDYVINRINSNRSFNNYVDSVKMFSRFIIKKYDLKCHNIFEEIQPLDEINDPKSMEFDTFRQFMEKVTPENGIEKKEGKQTINHYREWIRTAFLLGLFTGGRREEVVKMKWSGVKETVTGEITHIEVIHYKLSRAKARGFGQQIEYIKRIEISQDLIDLLIKLGYEENKGKEEYILAPNEKQKRESMMEFISASFTHYYSLLNLPEKLQFKNLRKTYSTELYAERGDAAAEGIGHEDIRTTQKYYIDQRRIAIKKGEQNKKRGGLFQKKFKL